MFGPKWIHSADIAFWMGFLVFAQTPQIFSSCLLSVTGHLNVVRSSSLAVLIGTTIAIGLSRLPNEATAIVVWSGSQWLGLALVTYFVDEMLEFSVTRLLQVVALPLAASCLMTGVVSLVQANTAGFSAITSLLLLSALGTIVYGTIIFCFGRRRLGVILRRLRDSSDIRPGPAIEVDPMHK
jgi:hypothetical protein